MEPADSRPSLPPTDPAAADNAARQKRVSAVLNNPRLSSYVTFDHQSQIGILILTLRDHLARLGRDQSRHKRQTTSITMLTVSLSAASSVLIGLSFKDAETSWVDPLVLKNTALLFTAVIAVVNAYDALFRPHRLWVREGKCYGLIKDILLKVELRAVRAKDEPVTSKEIEEFRAELAKVLQEDLESWVRQHGEELLSAKLPASPPPANPPGPKP